MSIPENLKKNKELREFLHQFVSCGTMCTTKCEGCNDDIDAIIDMVCEDYEEALKKGEKS
ncbi:MAG: hypothetical protein KAS04_03865 [Candidatus Aenigmarchaeota archaeon]|nr:hypothetical protein [Candidatus Aenigmarchaeota archaeon]MCK5640926.1 hypothetical protein [Gammaproteobacteria bacterium]